jgi:hypothetical protein
MDGRAVEPLTCLCSHCCAGGRAALSETCLRRYLTAPEGFQGRVLNKYGLKTEASGTIKVGSSETCRCASQPALPSSRGTPGLHLLASAALQGHASQPPQRPGSASAPRTTQGPRQHTHPRAERTCAARDASPQVRVNSLTQHAQPALALRAASPERRNAVLRGQRRAVSLAVVVERARARLQEARGGEVGWLRRRPAPGVVWCGVVAHASRLAGVRGGAQPGALPSVKGGSSLREPGWRCPPGGGAAARGLRPAVHRAAAGRAARAGGRHC